MSGSTNKADGRVLLSADIVPIRYDIKLTPDLEKFTFLGEETILIKTASDLSSKCCEVTMHAKELCFSSASVCSVDDEACTSEEAVQINVNLKKTTVTFVFAEAFRPNLKYRLTVNFSGFLNNQMAGFYRSSYIDIHGEKKIMVSTQFESLDARRAFPCWDEPAQKAVFGICLVVPSNLTAFSNMPEKSLKSLTDGKLKELTYLDTPLMSTYLVAFCIGEFDYVQKITAHGVLTRVYTPPGKSENGRFALDTACRTLDLFDNFFGIPYPLPKLDMVAIPEFAMGAMENWGLVTYREVELLISEDASCAQKQRVCTVVAHELAHQWFGNLVTMAWWDDLWLNEGFASWTENYAVDHLHPDWNMWDQFTTDHLVRALRLDALRSSHPIQVPIKEAEEVEEVFDSISYSKGGCVVRMIHAVLGKDTFQSGLAAYMSKHQYGNTETYDLWNAWEEASGLPVKEMMASWTEQMGFPLLKVTKETWLETEVILELRQEWFLSDGSKLLEEDAKKKWCIPILTCTADGTQPDLTFMREKTVQVTIPISSPGSWIKLNAGQEVLMRVLMTDKMLERLSDGIKKRTLSTTDRAGVVNDAYALVKAGAMKPSTLITLLSNYTEETDAVVWDSIEGVLLGLDSIMSNHDMLRQYFRRFARQLVLNLTKIVSWDPLPNDGHLTTLLRGTMVHLLSRFCSNDEDVLAEARSRFNNFFDDSTDTQNLSSDLRTSVFKIVLKNGGEDEYQTLMSYFERNTDPAEESKILLSLGETPDINRKRSTLEWSTSGAVKLQSFFYPIASVSRSSAEGLELSWQFYKDNFHKIKGMIGKASPSLMDACITCSCGSFCTMEKAAEVEKFFETGDHTLPLNKRTIQQTCEAMRANAIFLDRLVNSEMSTEAFWSKSMNM